MSNFPYQALQSQTRLMLERSESIVPALQAFSEELPPGRRRRQLTDVIGVLQRGDATEVIAAVGSLPEYWIPLLSATTSAKDPERLVREFLKESHQSEELRRQWWLTMAYPVAVVCLAALVMVMFALLIVPTFRDIFNDFEVQLPTLTVAVLAVSDWISNGSLMLVLGLLVLAGFILVQLVRLLPQRLRDWWAERFSLPFGRTAAMARFSRFTSDLLEAGIGVPNALRIAGVVSTRPRLSRGASLMANDVEANRAVASQAYARAFPLVILHALWADLPTEARICLLREVSSCYAERARLRVSWRSGFMEPLAVCVVGLLVGVTVIALFLPLVKLVQSLT